MPSIEWHTIMVGKLRNCDIKSPLLILVVLVSEHRIQNLANLENDDENLLLHISSKYYDIKHMNSLKLDLPSTFGLFHVNIASLCIKLSICIKEILVILTTENSIMK